MALCRKRLKAGFSVIVRVVRGPNTSRGRDRTEAANCINMRCDRSILTIVRRSGMGQQGGRRNRTNGPEFQRQFDWRCSCHIRPDYARIDPVKVGKRKFYAGASQSIRDAGSRHSNKVKTGRCAASQLQALSVNSDFLLRAHAAQITWVSRLESLCRAARVVAVRSHRSNGKLQFGMVRQRSY